jgi:prepilin-type processing-associated H-X9-DG protein
MYRHQSNGVYGINAVFVDGHVDFVPTRNPTSAQASQIPPTAALAQSMFEDLHDNTTVTPQ